jgi:hypothetical protein
MASLKVENCCICQSDFNDEIYLLCNHGFCRDCVIGWISAQISRKEMVTCPIPDCKQEIENSIVELLVGKEQYQKYDQNRLDSLLATEFTMFYCPGKGCNGIVSVQNGSILHVQCPECRKAYCFQCKVEWHSGTNCEKYQQWAQENKQADALTFKLLNQIKAKQCPKCQTWIEKNQGCDHIRCVKCKYNFWWSSLQPYPHGKSTWSPHGSVFQIPRFHADILENPQIDNPQEYQHGNDLAYVRTRITNSIIEEFRRARPTPQAYHPSTELKDEEKKVPLPTSVDRSREPSTIEEIKRLFLLLPARDQGSLLLDLNKIRDLEIPNVPYTQVNLALLTIKQLSAICRQLNLFVSGSKQALIDRILLYEKNKK